VYLTEKNTLTHCLWVFFFEKSELHYIMEELQSPAAKSDSQSGTQSIQKKQRSVAETLRAQT
jgi:hypothetical protein